MQSIRTPCLQPVINQYLVRINPLVSDVLSDLLCPCENNHPQYKGSTFVTQSTVINQALLTFLNMAVLHQITRNYILLFPTHFGEMV